MTHSQLVKARKTSSFIVDHSDFTSSRDFPTFHLPNITEDHGQVDTNVRLGIYIRPPGHCVPGHVDPVIGSSTMSSLRYGSRYLRDFRATATKPYLTPRPCPCRRPTLTSRAASRSTVNVRRISTTTPRQQDLELEGAISRGDENFRAMVNASKTESDSGVPSVQVAYARPMPVSPSYFSRHTTFNDSYVLVQDLSRKYGRLPTVTHAQAERVAWKSKDQYRLAIGEKVKGRDYADCIQMAKRLHQIHPDLMPDEVKDGIRPFKRDINFYLNVPKPLPIDKFGRSHGVGRRKESVAQAWIVEGTGEVMVNGKSLAEAFGRVHDRESVLWGLKSMSRVDKYNVWAKAQGGGTTGQAEALAMAIAKALIIQEPALKTPLRKGKSRPLPLIIPT